MPETKTTQGAPRSLLTFLREGRAGNAAAAAPAARWGARRITALALAIVFPLVAILGLLGATSAQAADDEEAMKYSFYKVASSTTAFFSNVQEPGNSVGFDGNWAAAMSDPGSAGSMLGYADPDFSDVNGWLQSKLSGSSDAIGYETLLIREAGDSGNIAQARFQGMVDYAYFGAALKGMGLDSTSTGLGLPMMNWLAGGLVMLLFIMGGAVDFVFNAFIDVLALLNPFKLFYVGLSAVSPTLADGMVGNGNPDVGPLSGLVSWIGGWYQTLVSLSWAVMVPIFITFLVFGLLLFKKMDRGGAVKKLVIRLLFIGLGLPLLGSMYSGMLTSMQDASADGNSGSARVVMSTYVDFENWALKSRLAVPASGAVIEWNSSTNTPSGQAQANVRNTALAINNRTHNLNLNAIVSSGAYDASWSNQIMEGKATDAATSEGTFVKTVDMLSRFMSGKQVSAASFETISKGDLLNTSFYQNHANDYVKNWFEELSKDAGELGKVDPRYNPVFAVSAGQGLRATPGTVKKFTTQNGGCTQTGTGITIDGSTRACNLSPLAMYNYLNTDFDSTSMRMYSSSNVASEATRSIHNSVSQVGTGTMSFLYWLNAVVLLGAFVLIGLGYAFSMLFASVRRSIQTVTAIPFAVLGAIAAIAKVTVYSIALILEVIVTIFMYMMVQEFLSSLPQIIEMPFAGVLNNGAGGDLAGFVTFLVSGWGFSMVVTLLSIIGVVLFTVLALRVRKGFVKAVEEAVTKLVEKFMDSQVGLPGGGGLAPALAGGLASGAGAAAATRMMNREGKGPATALSAPGSKNGGPAGVSSSSDVTAPNGGGGAGGNLIPIAGGDGSDGPSGSDGADSVDPSNPNGGNGPLSLTSGNHSMSDEVELGRSVEANGLSKRDEVRAPQVGDDALSSASDSMDETAAGYKEAARMRREVGKEGAEAVGHAGLAVGRGFAGDSAGAAESGGKALEKGGSAVASGHEAKQKAADAGRSSLDKPDTKNLKAAENARAVSQAGGTVSRVAGAAGGAKGQSAAATQSASVPPQPTSSALSAGGSSGRTGAAGQTKAPRTPSGSGSAAKAPGTNTSSGRGSSSSQPAGSTTAASRAGSAPQSARSNLTASRGGSSAQPARPATAPNRSGSAPQPARSNPTPSRTSSAPQPTRSTKAPSRSGSAPQPARSNPTPSRSNSAPQPARSTKAPSRSGSAPQPAPRSNPTPSRSNSAPQPARATRPASTVQSRPQRPAPAPAPKVQPAPRAPKPMRPAPAAAPVQVARPPRQAPAAPAPRSVKQPRQAEQKGEKSGK